MNYLSLKKAMKVANTGKIIRCELWAPKEKAKIISGKLWRISEHDEGVNGVVVLDIDLVLARWHVVEKKPKGRWKPENGKKYWFVTAYGTLYQATKSDSNADKIHISTGNCFQSKELAQGSTRNQLNSKKWCYWTPLDKFIPKEIPEGCQCLIDKWANDKGSPRYWKIKIRRWPIDSFVEWVENPNWAGE